MEAVELAAPAAALASIKEQTKQEVAQVAVVDQAILEVAKSTPKKRKKIVRMQLPKQDVVIDPAGDLTGYVKIGEEATEVLEITPASFFIKRLIRNQWALKDQKSDSKGVLIAPIPSRTVSKGLLAESLLALPDHWKVCRSPVPSPAGGSPGCFYPFG